MKGWLEGRGNFLYAVVIVVSVVMIASISVIMSIMFPAIDFLIIVGGALLASFVILKVSWLITDGTVGIGVRGEDCFVRITKERYYELTGKESFLSCLEAAGVDNWDGYGYAVELHQEKKGKEC